MTSRLTTILCNNNVVINLSEDPTLHAHVKHIDIGYHFLHKCIQAGDITIQYINTKYDVANLFTKALAAPLFT